MNTISRSSELQTGHVLMLSCVMVMGAKAVGWDQKLSGIQYENDDNNDEVAYVFNDHRLERLRSDC